MSMFADARNNAVSRMDSMGVGEMGEPAAGAGKHPAGDVNYRPAEDPQLACQACVHFQPEGACEIVAGPIDPHGTCDLFEPPGGQEQVGAGAPTTGDQMGLPPQR